jgi:DNA modification methylase
MKQASKLMLGDNMESLKKLPDNCIDAVVSDGPYGLSAPKNSGKNTKGGFMGKKWDYDVPSVELWKEVFRVLKPGGHVLSFGGTRTYHRMVVNMEDAGFEIRDQIMWLYGSGFPKSMDIGKAYDKKFNNEREIGVSKGSYVSSGGQLLGENTRTERFESKGNSKYEGFGTCLKPAVEPICLARKSISEKTIIDNVIKWKTGGINIDGCRVGDDIISTHNAPKGTFAGGDEDRGSDTNSYSEHQGRFPANLILDEEAGKMLGEPSRFFYCAKVSKKERNLGLDDFDVEINTSTIKLFGKIVLYNNKIEIIWEKEDVKVAHQVDTGPSQKRDIDEFGAQQKNDMLWNIELFGKNIMDQFQKVTKYTTKTKINSTTIYQILNASIQQLTNEHTATLPKEMMDGIKFVENVELKNTKVIITNQKKDGSNQNVSNVSSNEVLSLSVIEKSLKSVHPTMKPVKLMRYLCRLITPKGGLILDPYMGSGSTGIAALLEDFRFCGMEMDEDYFKIAEARIKEYKKYDK